MIGNSIIMKDVGISFSESGFCSHCRVAGLGVIWPEENPHG
jgi:hypothetical protein